MNDRQRMMKLTYWLAFTLGTALLLLGLYVATPVFNARLAVAMLASVAMFGWGVLNIIRPPMPDRDTPERRRAREHLAERSAAQQREQFLMDTLGVPFKPAPCTKVRGSRRY